MPQDLQPLMSAVFSGKEKNLGYLIQAKYSLEQKDEMGYTPSNVRCEFWPRKLCQHAS